MDGGWTELDEEIEDCVSDFCGSMLSVDELRKNDER